MTRINAQALRKGRTEEGKEWRRVHGDNEERFNARFSYPGNDGIGNCITMFVFKDDLIVEYEEY